MEPKRLRALTERYLALKQIEAVGELADRQEMEGIETIFRSLLAEDSKPSGKGPRTLNAKPPRDSETSLNKQAIFEKKISMEPDSRTETSVEKTGSTSVVLNAPLQITRHKVEYDPQRDRTTKEVDNTNLDQINGSESNQKVQFAIPNSSGSNISTEPPKKLNTVAARLSYDWEALKSGPPDGDDDKRSILGKARVALLDLLLRNFAGSEEEGRERRLALLFIPSGVWEQVSSGKECGDRAAKYKCDSLLSIGNSGLQLPEFKKDEGLDDWKDDTLYVHPARHLRWPALYHELWERAQKRARTAARYLSDHAPGGFGLPVAIVEEELVTLSETLWVVFRYLHTGLIRPPNPKYANPVDAISANARYCEVTGACPSTGFKLHLAGLQCLPANIYGLAWFKPASVLRIYDGGRMQYHIMRGRDGLGWIYRSRESTWKKVENVFKQIFETTSSAGLIDLLDMLYDVCILLSEERKGAAIYLVDARARFDCWVNNGKGIVNVPAVKRHEKIRAATHIKTLTINEISHYLQHDGATILTVNGHICAFGAYFAGVGGRKAIAKDVVRQEGAGGGVVAIVISQDGGMAVYFTSETEVQVIDLQDRLNLGE